MPVENEVRSRLGHNFGLIETLRWEPSAGGVRLELHLGRMRESAKALGIAFDEMSAREMIAEINALKPLRLRLLLEYHGLSLTALEFQPQAADAVWNVKMARTRLASTDPLLQHKTTERQAYESARAEFTPAEADEVLMENEHGFICEGTITSLFVEKAGSMVTPRHSHGLLRGVLRQELLDTGKAIEGDLTRADLQQFPFFLGNSLRGLIRGRFTS